LIAGGKSFGGRMTSQAQADSRCRESAASPSSASRCTPPGGPSDEGGKHLFDVRVPMLFMQGTPRRARGPRVAPAARRDAWRAGDLEAFPDADHSFHVPARTGSKDAEIRGEMLYALAGWIDRVIRKRRAS
jgi:predicted alpha/beta-hydrolase family hydrolase